ncbi:MAG: MATE family efflux transporter [Clostridia bacterium]|nr:MATE family efflux transporter [Clostridia bacterium]
MAMNLQSLFATQDLTKGKPIHGIIRFSIPLLIGNLAQQLYNTVDSIVVGKYVGDQALAAVGAAGPVLNLLIVLFVGVSVGGTIMVSQYFGARDREHLDHTVGNTITLAVLSALIIMVIGPLLTRPLLDLLQTPSDIYEMTCSYLVIIFVGVLGGSFYNIMAGVLRGLGDSVGPVLFLIVACFLNIGLDLLFVIAFSMDVAGVALATVLAQFVSAALCMWRLMRMKEVVSIHKKYLRPKKEYIAKLIRLGLPSGASQAIFSTAALIVQSLTNSFGTNVIACCTVVMRVDAFAMMPNFTFGTAMTTYTGQNIGARRIDRVEKGMKAGLLVSCVTSVVLVTAILLAGPYLIEMFTKTQEVIDMGTHMLQILAFGYLMMAVSQVFNGIMNGAGDTLTPMFLSIITTVVIRMPLAYLLNEWLHSPDCLFISLLIAWTCGAILSAIMFKVGPWRRRSVASRDAFRENGKDAMSE